MWRAAVEHAGHLGQKRQFAAVQRGRQAMDGDVINLAPSTSVASAVAPGAGCGTAASAASKAAPCVAVLARAGMLSAKSPCCGMHTSLQT